MTLPDIVDAWRETRGASIVVPAPTGGFHPSFLAVVGENTLLLKIHEEEAGARTEQGANHYLSRAFSFVVPTSVEEPFSDSESYVTEQDFVDAEEDYSIVYHLSSLAELHQNGAAAMPEGSVPKLRIPSYLEITAALSGVASSAWLRSVRDEYETGREIAMSEESLLHGDPKVQNWHGEYLTDLERVCLGHPAWDLAFVMNDPLLELPDDDRHQVLDAYALVAECDGRHLCNEVGPVRMTRALNSIAWNVIHADREGETGREKIEYLLSHFGAY